VNNKLKSYDKVILFICVALIGICWVLILNPNYLHSDNVLGQKIGSVSTDGSGVRKKISSAYFWKDIMNMNNLYDGDAVFVGDDSSALVEFDNGNTLKLNANSLIKFKNKNNNLSLDLAFGQAQIESKTKIKSNGQVNSKAQYITVTDCGKDIQVEVGAAKFDINKGRDCGDIQFKVKSGSVKVANKNIDKNTEPNVLSFNGTGALDKLIKSVQKPRLKSPDNIKAQVQRLKSGSLLLTANWDVVAKANEYEMEVSSDPEMRNNRKIYRVKTNNIAITAESSTVYYHLRANESPELVGEFSQVGFTELAESLAVPQIIITNFKVVDLNKLALQLEWQLLDKASQYHVEISETVDFAKVQAQTVTTARTQFLNLKLTSVYARVRAENPRVKGEYSVPILVSFKYNIQNKSAKVLSKKCIVQSSGEVGSNEEFNIDWKPVPMAQKYIVRVVNANKSAELSRVQSRGPASNITVPGCGEYDIKVEAYDKSDRKISSEFNSTKVIYKSTLALLKPVISEANKDMNIFVQKGVARFTWLKWFAQKRQGGVFKVEIATNIDFTENYKQFSVKDNKLLLKDEFKAGQYFWRVQERSADHFSDWSDLGKVKIIVNSSENKIK